MTDNDKYAVFGNPIKHSKSPLIHAAFADQCDQSMRYRAVRVDLDDFALAANRFFEGGGLGLNVTVPFKVEALHFAQKLSDRAERAGAVKTLINKSDGTILGDNTEAESIRELFAEAGAGPGTCAVGTVKSMIGHTKACAGVAGLVKTILALQRRIADETAETSHLGLLQRVEGRR